MCVYIYTYIYTYTHIGLTRTASTARGLDTGTGGISTICCRILTCI